MKTHQNNPGPESVLRDGLYAAWPICLGYVPIGLAFGILAQKAGLGPFEVGMMSVLVFAGSSQFIAVSMISAGAAPASIVLTAFVVNLRHFLMSSSLSLFFGKEKRSRLLLFAYGVTDESFAVNLSRFADGAWDFRRALVVNQSANFVWIASTVAGAFGGRFISPGAFGIDYALVAMFICLLVFQLRGKIYLMTAVISGAVAVAVSLAVPGNAHVVIAAVFAAAAGVAAKRLRGGSDGKT
jgi:4-azaleucine resistance transporter AzlC